MDGDKSVTATFTINIHTLTVTVVGNGSVTSDPTGIDGCPGADCTENYNFGTAVTLTAVADAGWSFSGWTVDLTGTTNPDTVTMDGDKSVTATFLDLTAPVLKTATVAATSLFLTYDEPLDTGSVPATGDFAIAGQTVTLVAVSGSTVTLTLDPGVASGDPVTVSYTGATNPIQDPAGNVADDLDDQAVTVFDQIIFLTEANDWTLISAPQLLSAVPVLIGDGEAAMLAFVNGAFISPGDPGFDDDVVKPVSAFYVKADGLVGIGFNFAFRTSPGFTSKDLTDGWNLIGTNNSGLAENELSSLQVTEEDEQLGGLVTLFVPDKVNARKNLGHIDWRVLIDGVDDGDHDLNANPITDLPARNLSTLDGYWAFLLGERPFSKNLKQAESP